MKTENQNSFNSFLSFKLGDETYACHVSKVLNILEMTKITKVPKAPEYMLGVINLRGTVLPVVDTRIKFGMNAAEFTNKTCIIVTELSLDNETILCGAIVDSVQEVLEIEDSEIQAPPSIGTKFKSEFITGVVKNNDEFIMLLDMEKIFSVDEIIILQQNNEKTTA